jgi:serine/threonine-protein kinase RsbT
MQLLNQENFQIRTQNDIVIIRQKVRICAVKIGLGIVDQTKVVTAASELARNTLDYGGGGEMELCTLKNDLNKPGIRLTFVDQGPGISDIALALTDGYTSGKGMGLGLSGSKRLMNEFEIETEVGKGTRVIATKWK